MVLLDNEVFLETLTQISSNPKECRSLWLTFKQHDDVWRKGMKRVKDKALREEERASHLEEQDRMFELLVRARTSKRKISTRVSASDSSYFQRKLHNIILLNITQRRK